MYQTGKFVLLKQWYHCASMGQKIENGAAPHTIRANREPNDMSINNKKINIFFFVFSDCCPTFTLDEMRPSILESSSAPDILEYLNAPSSPEFFKEISLPNKFYVREAAKKRYFS